MADQAPYDLKVKRYFPRVKDFERAENGDPIPGSLKGPERIEARMQLSRELVVAGAEAKILAAKLEWCYFKEGVNHLENCKDLVLQHLAKTQSPYYGMKGAPSKTYGNI